MSPDSGGRRDGRVQRSGGTVWRAVLTGLALVALAGTAAVARLASTPPIAVATPLGSTPPGAIGLLQAIPLAGQVKPSPDWLAMARRALAAEPLASRPFVVAAALDFPNPQSTGTPGAAALLAEALRRDPRSRPARLFLLRRQAALGQLGEALAQISALRRLNSDATDQMLTMLGQGLTAPADIEEATDALGRYPELAPGFLRGLVARPRDRSLLVRVAKDLPEGLRADPVVRDALLDGLVKAGAVAEARALFGPRAGQGSTALVHSPDFADATTPPPFNWTLEESASGVAERTDNGLAVTFYGRESGTLASQLLGLAPGPYRAELTYRLTEAAPGGLVARMRCATGDQVLGSRSLDGVTERALRIRFDARVPATGCEGQRLEIVAQTVEGRRPVSAVVRSFAVARASSR